MLKRTLIGAAVLAVTIAAWLIDRRHPGQPAWAVAALGAVLMLGALDELLRLGGATPRRRTLGRLAGVAWLVLALAAGLSDNRAVISAGDVLTAGAAAAGAYLALQLRHGPGPSVARLTESLWFGVPYVGGLACLVTLLASGRLQLVMGLALVAKSSDTGAYFTGRLWGRRKLAPSVSPGKTVEGALGGLVLPVLVALLLLWGAPVGPAPAGGAAPVVPGGAAGAALLGLAIGALAILSDLAESLLKRSCSVKDSSSLFGRAGGFLDLVDSLLLVGPLGLAYTALVA